MNESQEMLEGDGDSTAHDSMTTLRHIATGRQLGDFTGVGNELQIEVNSRAYIRTMRALIQTLPPQMHTPDYN